MGSIHSFLLDEDMAPKQLAICRDCYPWLEQQEITCPQVPAVDREYQFLVLVVKGDHIGGDIHSVKLPSRQHISCERKYLCAMDMVFTLDELPFAASHCVKSLNGAKVLAFHGEMGAGKTTFIHAICEAMQVRGNVSSPTFALVNEYRTDAGDVIYHMDWYRLKDEAEALQAGMEEYLYSGRTCLVEWPDRAPDLLPENTVHLRLEVLDPRTRRLYSDFD